MRAIVKESRVIYITLSVIGAILLVPLLSLTSCQATGLLFTENGEIECGGDGKAIKLDNSDAATDPTFDELIAFIRLDPTDSREYRASGSNAYVCADFAEDVHNNAERAGIRAGWVGITFENTREGHAINAFETTDKGLVYIDCTSGGKTQSGDDIINSWDNIAYIKIGEKYGVIHIDRAESLSYNYYVEYEKKWREYRELLKEYNAEVDEYNQEINGKKFVLGSPEEISINAWKERLDEQASVLDEFEKELGDTWYESQYASHMIKNVLIHW